MRIDRERLVRRHQPVHEGLALDAPLTVGNGTLGFTADVTGTQSLGQDYAQAHFPLLTMADWGWHATPAEGGEFYTLQDVAFTTYPHEEKGSVRYAVQPQPGNEAVYHWLRQNPHRFHLGRVSLLYRGRPLRQEQLSGIRQTLDLYTGVLTSQFLVDGVPVSVLTCCHHSRDTLGFEVRSSACADGTLSFRLDFPYPAPDITGADFSLPGRHTTQILEDGGQELCLLRRMDRDSYRVRVSVEAGTKACSSAVHQFDFAASCDTLRLCVGFHPRHLPDQASFDQCRKASESGWRDFWENGGIVSFEGSADPRAMELERRVILSLYLSAINSCGRMPPQETGLTVNSWFGKAHLEMHLWHTAYLPLWGRTAALLRSLPWYKAILPRALENAARNGYKGAKWPKMVGPEGVDCPSSIATLLIWQQPHIIYMLELAYQSLGDEALLREYWPLVEATAEYMADFPVYNAQTGFYDLAAPLIPAQECHRPMDTRNPAFELEYWRLGLDIACLWARRLGLEAPGKWGEVSRGMAPPPEREGRYLAHEQCPDTFTAFNRDHPSMVAAMGLLPGDRMDADKMRDTLSRVREVWNFDSMWGWDFAMMAMSYTRLLMGREAVDILLFDTKKNRYVLSGNNRQVTRNDLPLYMPGNGSLLLALPLMICGFPGNHKPCPGFPDDGSWVVRAEGLRPFPY